MTTFVISWVNPDEKLAHKNFEDYMHEGTLAALDAIEKATGEPDANVIGYCLGGTLLAATLGHLAAKKDKRIASATFMTSLIDFTAAGELEVFIDEAQVASLERKMNERGYLEGSEMASTFNMLRANDLIWSFVINNYLLGRDPFPFDLLHWNCDSTRMPAAMHSFYLRNMYMNNLLAQPGALTLAGTKIDLVARSTTPTYFVSAIEDHIAPWKTTYAGTAAVRAARARSCCRDRGTSPAWSIRPPRNKYGYWTNDKLPDDAESGSRAPRSTKARGGRIGGNGSRRYLGREVPPRVPGKGKLKVIEAAPGTYARIRADGK